MTYDNFRVRIDEKNKNSEYNYTGWITISNVFSRNNRQTISAAFDSNNRPTISNAYVQYKMPLKVKKVLLPIDIYFFDIYSLNRRNMGIAYSNRFTIKVTQKHSIRFNYTLAGLGFETEYLGFVYANPKFAPAFSISPEIDLFSQNKSTLSINLFSFFSFPSINKISHYSMATISISSSF
ncbi:hypothetical protein JYT44_03640 [Caldithrix abyssi]|nr:hypothetical protein [Caldithrix abyssi]